MRSSVQFVALLVFARVTPTLAAPPDVPAPADPSPPAEQALSVATLQEPPLTKEWVDAAIAAALAKQATDRPIPVREPDRFVESNVVSLVGREGFRWQDRAGQFLLNPYVLMQTRAQFIRHDDTYLELSDPDNLSSVGFAIPNAILGVAGKAAGLLTFNLALNGPCAGACLLNEAWLEGNFSEALRVRAGKFKTPMSLHTQTRLGSRLAPVSPTSLVSRVNLAWDLNAQNPTLGTGFDVGLMVHGELGGSLRYQLGVFNGEGIQVNAATSSLSDDSGVPALLYAARLTYAPLGPVAFDESGPATRGPARLHLGLSASYNVEGNVESSNDLRAGIEIMFATGDWMLAAESYLLHMHFTERMRGTPSRLFLGSYATVARMLPANLEVFARMDAFDRNSTREKGILMTPGLGLNAYLAGPNLKLQILYQYTAAIGHEDSAARVDDIGDLGRHAGYALLQFAL